jgi:hypothetical protein
MKMMQVPRTIQLPDMSPVLYIKTLIRRAVTLQFSYRSYSSGLLHRVNSWVEANVSEEHTVSVFRDDIFTALRISERT